MNQHFKSARFGRLLRKHTAEYLPSYLMSTAVLAGGVLIVLGTLTYLTHRPLERELQIVLFEFGLLAGGRSVYVVHFFGAGHPARGRPGPAAACLTPRKIPGGLALVAAGVPGCLHRRFHGPQSAGTAKQPARGTPMKSMTFRAAPASGPRHC